MKKKKRNRIRSTLVGCDGPAQIESLGAAIGNPIEKSGLDVCK
jgi:hypothetical protein